MTINYKELLLCKIWQFCYSYDYISYLMQWITAKSLHKQVLNAALTLWTKKPTVVRWLHKVARSNVTAHWLQRGTALTAREAPECPPRACLNTGATRMRQDGWMEPTPPPGGHRAEKSVFSLGKPLLPFLHDNQCQKLWIILCIQTEKTFKLLLSLLCHKVRAYYRRDTIEGLTLRSTVSIVAFQGLRANFCKIIQILSKTFVWGLFQNHNVIDEKREENRIHASAQSRPQKRATRHFYQPFLIFQCKFDRKAFV